MKPLTPKGLRGVFSKKYSKTAVSSSRSPTEFFSFLITFNCKILPYTTTRKCPKSFAKVDHTDCEIITFEVQRKVFFHCAWQGQLTLTARGANFSTMQL
jgi:hypothetical protein